MIRANILAVHQVVAHSIRVGYLFLTRCAESSLGVEELVIRVDDVQTRLVLLISCGCFHFLVLYCLIIIIYSYLN